MNAIENQESAHLDTPPGVFDSSSLDRQAYLFSQSYLACPTCNDGSAPLIRIGDEYECANCRSTFPLLNCSNREVAWLFANADTAFAEWRDRYLSCLKHLEEEVCVLERRLKLQNVNKLTRVRLRHLLSAKQAYAKQIAEIVAPFNLAGRGSSTTNDLLLSRNHGLTSYITNVFRDWAWHNGELEVMFNVISKLLDEAKVKRFGKLLTLGSGPGGLTSRLEQFYPLDASIRFDISPLFAAIDCAMATDQQVQLYEFPIAPLDTPSTAVLRSCQDTDDCGVKNLSKLSKQQSAFVLGDMHNLPFTNAAFDTVLTPWLIDILPGALDRWLIKINRLLPMGGTWINTGSLNFEASDPLNRYSAEETMDLLQQYGFKVQAHSFANIPYLQSPASAHRRMERVFSFCAAKVKEVEPRCEDVVRPNWQLDPTAPVPKNSAWQYACSQHLIRAQVLGAVDGRRSVARISMALSKQYELSNTAARNVVDSILQQTMEKPKY